MTDFSPEALERIAKATIATERANRTPRAKTPRTTSPQSLGHWAKVTTAGGPDNTGKYSWQAIKPKDISALSAQSPDWTIDLTWGSGTVEANYAVELGWQSKWVILNDVVWLYPAKTQPYYLFDYNPRIKQAKLTGILPARGSSPGSASVEVMAYDPDESTWATSQSITLYNSFLTALGEEEESYYLNIHYNYGLWWVSSCDCTPVEAEEE